MSRFNDGDRVIITQFESPYGVDLTGFYGHVRGTYNNASVVPVVLEGCLASAPDREEAEYVIEDCQYKPYPCFEHELEHAD